MKKHKKLFLVSLALVLATSIGLTLLYAWPVSFDQLTRGEVQTVRISFVDTSIGEIVFQQDIKKDTQKMADLLTLLKKQTYHKVPQGEGLLQPGTSGENTSICLLRFTDNSGSLDMQLTNSGNLSFALPGENYQKYQLNYFSKDLEKVLFESISTLFFSPK